MSNIIKTNKGQISIKWLGSSVSGLVVIGGIIAYLLGDKTTGVLLIILGLFGAIFMTVIIRGR